MARYNKQTVSSIAGINSELTKIQTAISDSLSRKGDTPNQMEGTLDMNSSRVINLPEPVADHEPFRKGDLPVIEATLQPIADAAQASADAALASELEATNQANRAEAEADRAEFNATNTGWFAAAGSFEDGGTITERNQYLQLIADAGSDIAGGYSWGGALPKVVPPGSTPATTGGIGPDAWVYRSDTTLRSALAAADSDVLVGGVEAGKITKNFSNVADLKSASGLQSGQYARTLYHTAAPFGSATYRIVNAAEYESFTGLTSPDGYRDHALVGGLIAMLTPTNGKITVQQCGAIPFTNDLSSAQNNTEAFRYACMSYETEWNAIKSANATNKRVWGTVAESGDYLLSNGFTVPKGWSFTGGSLGSTRLKILPAFADTNPIPVITLGKSIDVTGATVTHSGIYVANPPPYTSDLYINPQDVRTGIDTGGTPGFSMGTLWIQAATCIDLSESGDGIISKLFLEADSSIGVLTGSCQNIIIDEFYTFDMNNPLVLSGNPNNISIGLMQCNYTRVAPVQTNDGATIKAVNISKLIVNQNAQFGTFTSCVRLRSASIDLNIAEMECYNYNGWAVDNETGIGNVVTIGRAKLRQSRNRAEYDQGNTAKGFRANNCQITVNELDSDVSDNAIGELAGSFAASLMVNRAVLRGQASGTLLCNISHTNAAASPRLELLDIDNRTTKALFNQNDNVSINFKTLVSPFPLVSEGGRQAIKLPFRGAGIYKLTLRANTNPGGNEAYRKIWSGCVAVEISYTDRVVLHAELVALFNSNFGDVYSPQLTPQIDLNSVGTGDTITNASSALLVVSVPSNYQFTSYKIEQELFS